MPRVRCITEMGMGVDVHGRDATKAAKRAVSDAIRHSSLGFVRLLGKHHDKGREVWIKIHKVNSGLKSITQKEAIDVVLCWGWIDGICKGFDERSYLQRFCPRGRKSMWSMINVGNVARLIAEGRMT